MKKIHLFGLLIGFIFLLLSIKITFTGAIIGTNIEISNILFLVISLTFVIGSIILYVANRSLESLVIPTGTLESDQKRIDAVMKSYNHTKDKPYILVSGYIDRDEQGRPKKESQQSLIYKELRKTYKISPSDMLIEGKSKDTLENFLYTIEKLNKKGINHMKIATNPTQYWRFKLFEKEAKREGIIESSFKVDPLYTNESLSEFAYGVLAYIKDYIRVKSAGSLEEARNKKTGKFGNLVKKFI